MWGHDPRMLLLRALVLDSLGNLLILAAIIFIPGWLYPFSPELSIFHGQGLWVCLCLLLYPLLGWLFGSYTVLRWRRLAFSVLLQRLFLTTAVTFFAFAIARLLLNPADHIWLAHQRVQLAWLGTLTVWSLLMRIALRRGLLLPDTPRLLLLANDDERSGFFRHGLVFQCLRTWSLFLLWIYRNS